MYGDGGRSESVHPVLDLERNVARRTGICTHSGASQPQTPKHESSGAARSSRSLRRCNGERSRAPAAIRPFKMKFGPEERQHPFLLGRPPKPPLPSSFP